MEKNAKAAKFEVMKTIRKYTIAVIALTALLWTSFSYAKGDGQHRGSGIYSPYALEDAYDIETADISSTASYADYIVVMDELQVASYANIFGVLQGKVPGLRTTPYGISLRGNGRPLYVIDGVPADAFAASSISPLDVATVEIHNGMSASLFGRRGINGAIVLNTKRG